MDEDVLEQIKHLLNDAGGPVVTTTGFALMDTVGPYISTFMIVGGIAVLCLRLYIGWNEARAWWLRRKEKNGK